MNNYWRYQILAALSVMNLEERKKAINEIERSYKLNKHIEFIITMCILVGLFVGWPLFVYTKGIIVFWKMFFPHILFLVIIILFILVALLLNKYNKL